MVGLVRLLQLSLFQFKDEQFTDGTMAGETFPCGRVAGALRKCLFREHLGLMETDLECEGVSLDDPCCDDFYRNVWKATSKQNTDVYEEVCTNC